MDTGDRSKITHNLVQLVEQTSLDDLLGELVDRNVFTNDMVEKYKDGSILLKERKRTMYLDLQRRGPLAFRQLIESLLVTGHLELVQILEPELNIQEFLEARRPFPPTRQGTSVTVLPGYMLEEEQALRPRIQTLALHTPLYVENLSREPLRIVVKNATVRRDNCTSKLQAYPMGSRPRGYFFMINNIEFRHNVENERIGSEVDERNLDELFTALGFIVIKHRNVGFQDMKRKISDFAKMPEHSRYDCCAVALMSHGRAADSKLDSAIVSWDGHLLTYDWVLEQFTNENAPSLRARPKVFLFQTCRGLEEDYGVRLTTAARVQTDGSASIALRTISDMLIGYSTLPGFVSNRDRYLGTWYIQAVCEIFMEHACDTDIEDMLKMVDQKLARLQTENKRAMQTSSYENRGFRKLYFNPGLYDEPAGLGEPLR